MGFALVMYEMDNKRFPPKASQVKDFMNPSAFGWKNNALYAIAPYLQNNQNVSQKIYLCPVSILGTGPLVVNNPTALSGTSYMPNVLLMEKSLAAIKNPSQLVCIQESTIQISFCALRPAEASDLDGPAGFYSYWHDNQSIGKELYSANHFDGGNLIFADGHVEFRNRMKLRSGDFGLNPSNDTQNAQSSFAYSASF